MDLELESIHSIINRYKDDYPYIAQIDEGRFRLTEEVGLFHRSMANQFFVRDEDNYKTIYRFKGPVEGSTRFGVLVSDEKYSKLVLSANETDLIDQIRANGACN